MTCPHTEASRCAHCDRAFCWACDADVPRDRELLMAIAECKRCNTCRTTTRLETSVVKFTDRCGSKCSLQDSSLASEDAIWFGVDPFNAGPRSVRMHLTKGMVRDLMPYLHSFLETGSIVSTIHGWPSARRIHEGDGTMTGDDKNEITEET